MNLLSRLVPTGLKGSSRDRALGLIRNLTYHGIFWSWNGLFLLVVYLGFMPWIGASLIASLVSGQIPFPFVVPLFAFLATPPICTVVGLRYLRKSSTSLMRLFYGVEAPIMALAILRLFVLRELTPASTLMVVAGALAIATVVLELVFGYAAYSKGLARFQMAAHTLVLIAGLYIGGLLLFYTIPIMWVLLVNFIQLTWVGAIAQQIQWAWQAYEPQNLLDLLHFLISGALHSLFVIGILALIGFSSTLFVGMPYALVVVFSRSWSRIRHAFSQQFGAIQAWSISGGTAIALALLFAVTYPQPQVKAFALLAQPPESVNARQILLQQSPQIRQGLVNAYLMQYRYISSWSSANNLTVWYPAILPLTHEQASILQTWHNALMSPFLYQGDRDDSEKAAKLYADFFDMPIQKAESAAIQQALQSTVEQESVEASLLNISDRVVFLAQQEVTIKPAGDWAEITLYERYENLTQEDQEIVYQFSLPESAAITGVWLAEADMTERFRFVVSPRGAAQRVYQQEIERAQQAPAEDPALLEQVGPRQYRLRVFPIPQRERRGQPGITHLWLTYRVAQQDGTWPLPQLTEKRNLYWNRNTQRLRRGESLQQADDIWYEATISAAKIAEPQVHTATLAEGYQVTATPFTEKSPQSLLANQRLAVLIDTSRSMGDRQAELAAALEEAQAIAMDTKIDWFLTSEEGISAQKLSQAPTLKDFSFYGSLTLIEQLQQLANLSATEYDAIFVLTDAGNYELEEDAAVIPTLPGSLWLIHLGGAVPTAYADPLLQHLIDTKGGVATTFAEAVNRLSTEQQIAGTVMDGYQWTIAPINHPANAVNEASFQPLAARQAIRWLSRNRDVTQVSELDRLHTIAKRTEIVTPYSSMLVLVNDRQREALQIAENEGDRFDREIAAGEDILTNPGDPLNASVPEPSAPFAMVLIGTIFCGLLWRSRSSRQISSRRF